MKDATFLMCTPINTQRAGHVGRYHLGRFVHVGQATDDEAPVRNRAPEMSGLRSNFGVPESKENLRPES